jgi:uncharacterized protein (DUF488 family)
MDLTLFTIGFTKKTAEDFFHLLQEAGVGKIVDVRENRGGQLAGFAKYPDIAFFVHRLLGIEYVHEPLLAPSPEIRKEYRKTRDWARYERSFLELMDQRKVLGQLDPSAFEANVALLCSEAGPDKCHRRLVAEMLAAHWRASGHKVEIKHLVIDRPVPRRKRQTKRNVGSDPV